MPSFQPCPDTHILPTRSLDCVRQVTAGRVTTITVRVCAHAMPTRPTRSCRLCGRQHMRSVISCDRGAPDGRWRVCERGLESCYRCYVPKPPWTAPASTVSRRQRAAPQSECRGWSAAPGHPRRRSRDCPLPHGHDHRTFTSGVRRQASSILSAPWAPTGPVAKICAAVFHNMVRRHPSWS